MCASLTKLADAKFSVALTPNGWVPGSKSGAPNSSSGNWRDPKVESHLTTHVCGIMYQGSHVYKWSAWKYSGSSCYYIRSIRLWPDELAVPYVDRPNSLDIGSYTSPAFFLQVCHSRALLWRLYISLRVIRSVSSEVPPEARCQNNHYLCTSLVWRAA